MRHGSATAVLANVNRDAKNRPEPYVAEDFIYWRETTKKEEEDPVLMDDPAAQSNLIRAALFGIAPKQPA